MVNVPVFIDGGSKETVVEEKKGGKLRKEGIVWMEHQREGKGKAKEMK